MVVGVLAVLKQVPNRIQNGNPHCFPVRFHGGIIVVIIDGGPLLISEPRDIGA